MLLKLIQIKNCKLTNIFSVINRLQLNVDTMKNNYRADILIALKNWPKCG